MSKGGFWKGLFKGVGVALACVGASAIVYGTVPQFKELIDTKVFKQEQVTDDNTNQDGNNTSANEALAELQAKLAEANALLAEKDSALENKQTELESAEANVTALEAAVAAKETLLTEKQTALDTAIAERDAIQAELDASEETNTELQAELEAKNTEITGLQSEIATLTSEKAELQSMVDELETQVTTLESEVETLEAEKAELEESIANQYPDMAIFNSIFSTTSYGCSVNEDEYLVASSSNLYIVNTKSVTASLLSDTTAFVGFEKLSNNDIVCFTNHAEIGYFVESTKTFEIENVEYNTNRALMFSNGRVVLYSTNQTIGFTILNPQTFEKTIVPHTEYSGSYGLAINGLIEHNGNIVIGFNTSKSPVLLYNFENESLSQLFAYENSYHSKFFVTSCGDILCGGSKDLYVVDGSTYETTKLYSLSTSFYFRVFYETSNGKILIKSDQSKGLYLYDTNSKEFSILLDSTSQYISNFTEEGYIVTIAAPASMTYKTLYFNIYTNEISETLSDVELTDDELAGYQSAA